MERLVGSLGLLVMMLLAWLMSSGKRQINGRIVLGGLFLQFAFAVLILKTPQGRAFFNLIGMFFQNVLECVDAGSAFVFDIYPRDGEAAGCPPRTRCGVRLLSVSYLPLFSFRR